MDDDSADVVRVSFEGRDFLRGVVIVNADLKVVRTTDDPILAGDESPCSYGDIGELKGLDNCL